MPPLTTADSSALVSGGMPSMENTMRAPQPNAQPTVLRVKVLRAFQDHRRQTTKVDSEIELPRLFALEMRAANKVQILPEQAPAAPPPASDDKPSKPAKKGDANAS